MPPFHLRFTLSLSGNVLYIINGSNGTWQLLLITLFNSVDRYNPLLDIISLGLWEWPGSQHDTLLSACYMLVILYPTSANFIRLLPPAPNRTHSRTHKFCSYDGEQRSLCLAGTANGLQIEPPLPQSLQKLTLPTLKPKPVCFRSHNCLGATPPQSGKWFSPLLKNLFFTRRNESIHLCNVVMHA